LGEKRNWDYRYCWLRDAAFTLESLLSVGYHEEAKAWKQWLLQSVGRDVQGMQVMYGIHGERHIPECELPWLSGYKGSSPVRIGNSASQQLQLDVYGEVADASTQMSRAGLVPDRRLGAFRKEMTDYVAAISRKPASGIWERRKRQEHFVYSKVMAWLCLDEGVQAAQKGEVRSVTTYWTRRRDALHREICRKGFNRTLGSFVQAFGSKRLDASALLIPLFGFLPFDDERVRGTLRAIEQKLTRDGLVYRYLPESKAEKEPAFLACSFWLVQNLAGTKRRREAIALFESLLRLSNDVGLLAGEYDPELQRFTGNFHRLSPTSP
jgi:GH15 family glucan-1,4-alpha-glucosidase